MSQAPLFLLGLVAVLSGCDQQIAVERTIPLDHQGTLKVRSVTVNKAGDVVVFGESTAIGLVDSGLKIGHSDLHGDLRVLGSDNLAGLSVSYSGLGWANAGIVADSTNPAELYLWSQEAARFSVDKGLTWRDLSATLPYVRLSPVNINASPAGIFFAAASFQGLERTTVLMFRNSSGAEWRKLALPSAPDFGVYSIAFISPLDPCFLVSQVTNIVSHDCGSSWVSNASPIARMFPAIADPSSPGLAFANGSSTASAGLYRTEDGGKSWTRLPLEIEYLLSLSLIRDPERPGVVYAVGYEKSWRSVNRGDSWEPMPQPFSFSSIQTDFVRKRHYATKAGENAIYILSGDLKEVARVPVPQVVERLVGLIDGRLYVSVRPVADVFLARFRQNGELIAYTELGGLGEDTAGGVDVFPDGDILISGTSDDDTLPATSRIGTKPRGFAARISADLKQIRWLTRVPGMPRG